MPDDQPPESSGSSPRPTQYRALTLHKTGHVLAITTISSANDEIAIEVAKSMVDGHAVELWDGLRFIEHFPPAD